MPKILTCHPKIIGERSRLVPLDGSGGTTSCKVSPTLRLEGPPPTRFIPFPEGGPCPEHTPAAAGLTVSGRDAGRGDRGRCSCPLAGPPGPLRPSQLNL